jgi:hypothetical protein
LFKIEIFKYPDDNNQRRTYREIGKKTDQRKPVHNFRRPEFKPKMIMYVFEKINVLEVINPVYRDAEYNNPCNKYSVFSFD